MIRKLITWLLDSWERYYIIICFFLSVISLILYYYNIITNVKNTLPSVIDLSAAILAILGLLFTLVTLLKESALFDRIRKYFPQVEKDNYIWLRRIICVTLLNIFFILVICVLPSYINIIIKYIIAFINLFLFWNMVLGSLYCIKIIFDLTIKDVTFPSKGQMK